MRATIVLMNLLVWVMSIDINVYVHPMIPPDYFANYNTSEI